MTAQIEVLVTKVEKMGNDVVALELGALPGTSLPPFEAGAHIDVHIGPQIVRPYSLCNDPADPDRYRLAVLHDANSRGGSKVICTQWAAGLHVHISEPRNLFPLAPTAGRSVLIGGGIGITPLIAMAYSLAARGEALELHYCARDEAKAPFLTELSASPFATSVRSHLSSLRRFDLPVDVGAPAPADHLYVCGPEPFMDHVIEEARAIGWSDAQIHFEYFDAAIDVSGEPFKVKIGDGTEFEIPAGRSIADVLIEAGLDIEISCEKGICGSCITDVLDGLPDHRDHYLTEEEREANECMALCCSRAFTPLLRLDL